MTRSRQRKAESQRRDAILTYRLTRGEYDALSADAKRAKMSVSEYCRHKVLGMPVVQESAVKTPEQPGVWRTSIFADGSIQIIEGQTAEEMQAKVREAYMKRQREAEAVETENQRAAVDRTESDLWVTVGIDLT